MLTKLRPSRGLEPQRPDRVVSPCEANHAMNATHPDND